MSNPLTQQELDHLAEIREVCQTVNSAGWRRILAQMKSWVDEAQEDMIGAGYAADAVKAGLQNRWQQRVAMLRGVEKYVGACQDEKEALLLEAKQRSEPLANIPRDDESESWDQWPSVQ